MGWGDELEQRRLKKLGIKQTAGGASQKTKTKPKTEVGLFGYALLVGALAGGVTLWKRFKADRARSGSGGAGGSGSAFTFPKGGQKLGTAKGKAPAKAPHMSVSKSPVPSDHGANVPRNKQSNNKKNKQRKAEKRELKKEAEVQQKQRDSGREFVTPAAAGNQVPKEEDTVGGKEGQTFTTTTHTKVPSWYARVRGDRGND